MSVSSREIIKLGSSLVIKAPRIYRVLPRMEELIDVRDAVSQGFISPIEFMGIYQTIFERDIWEQATWEQRRYLNPILDFKYDNCNVPTIIVPYLDPFMSVDESELVENDDCLDIMRNVLYRNGLEDETIGEIFEGVLNVCDDFGMDEGDIIYNLSNCGFSRSLGFRVIDYGMSNELREYLCDLTSSCI